MISSTKLLPHSRQVTWSWRTSGQRIHGCAISVCGLLQKGANSRSANIAGGLNKSEKKREGRKKTKRTCMINDVDFHSFFFSYTTCIIFSLFILTRPPATHASRPSFVSRITVAIAAAANIIIVSIIIIMTNGGSGFSVVGHIGRTKELLKPVALIFIGPVRSCHERKRRPLQRRHSRPW